MATSQDVEFQGLHFHACTTNGLEETVLMLNELLLYLRSSKRDVLSGDKNIGNIFGGSHFDEAQCCMKNRNFESKPVSNVKEAGRQHINYKIYL